MALYWAAQASTQVAQGMSTQAQYLWASALIGAGWVVAGAVAWWYGDNDPAMPEHWYLQTQWAACTPDGGGDPDNPLPQ